MDFESGKSHLKNITRISFRRTILPGREGAALWVFSGKDIDNKLGSIRGGRLIKCLKMLFPGCDIQIVAGRKETDEDLEIQEAEKADIDNEEDNYLDN